MPEGNPSCASWLAGMWERSSMTGGRVGVGAMNAPPPRVPEGVPMGDAKASKPPWADRGVPMGVPRAEGVPMGELRVAGAIVEGEGPVWPEKE